MNAKLLFIHALSPIHCGTGQAISGIDLPIAREKPTGLPLVPGSSIKGVLRAREPERNGKLHLAVFGPDTANAADNAGSVQFSDANLLFLPVRSMRGTFAWVTSPYVLRRFARDCREAGVELGKVPTDPDEGKVFVASDRLGIGRKVVFEDFDFLFRPNSDFERLANTVAGLVLDEEDREAFMERVCLVSDDVMSLLIQTCTEITARIRLNPDTKTVEQGALWTEEALPVETVLCGLMVATPVMQRADKMVYPVETLFNHVGSLIKKSAVQLGGKATVGRGLCRLRIGG